MKNYNELLNKYNRVITQLKETKEKLDTKSSLLDDRDGEYKIVDKNIRELCESILAKDKSEMKLGEEYSWDNIELLELINKAKNTLRTYDKKRTDLMKNILRNNEEKDSKVQDLEDQIRRLSISEVRETSIDDVKKDIEKDKLKNNLPEKLKKADIDIVLDEDDFTQEEENKIDEAVATGKRLKALMNPDTVLTKDKARKIEKMKNSKTAIITIDFDKTIKKLKEIDKKTIKVLGKTGKSIQKEIVNELKSQNETDSKIRASIKSLIEKNIIDAQQIKNPITTSITALKLTPDVGEVIYQKLFNEQSEISEWDKIISEHDNLEHGYGIVMIKRELEKDKKLYKEVKDFNRNEAIEIDVKRKYVPDIVVVKTNGKKLYLEYERGTHTQADFNEKIDKIAKITDTINIIAPSDDDAKKILFNKIQNYVDNNYKNPVLKGRVIRLIGAGRILGKDIERNNTWKYVWHPFTSKDVEINE